MGSTARTTSAAFDAKASNDEALAASAESSRGPAPAAAAEQDEEEEVAERRVLHPDGSFRRRCGAIAQGLAASVAAYGAALAATGGRARATEDVVDLLHSAYTSGVAIRGIAALRGRRGHVVALPAAAASDDAMVVRMFCRSIGYFFADVLLILGELGLRGRRPHLWHGRLAHHAIQAVANLTCIFSSAGLSEQTLALRSVLCIAYFAEFSNIFLRLGNMLRRGGSGSGGRAQRALNVALLLSFALSRMVNFPFAIWVFAKARRHMQPGVVPLIGTIQASGYLLNLAWFAKIVRIARKPSPALLG